MAAASTPESQRDQLWGVPGNQFCADCGRQTPDWASINLGILVCLECSGIHRQLGTHISQVRSLMLDVNCWQGPLLATMCSIGNASFNKVWEAGMPPEVIRPQEFPDNKAVRESFIFAKYKERAFFRPLADLPIDDPAASEAEPPPLAPQLSQMFPRGREVSKSGRVLKLAGSTGMAIFKSTKWDERVLRVEDRRLSYLHHNKVKNEFSLDGCEVFLDRHNEHPGHPHTFSVRTPQQSSTEGRTFSFQCSSDMEAVEWAQSLRLTLGQASDPGPQQPATPEPCVLGGTVQQLTDASRDWVLTSTIKAGPCHVLSVPNGAGVWMPAHAVLTTYCLFVFTAQDAQTEEWSRPICSIPLQHSELESRLNLVPTGAAGHPEQRFRFSTWFPLGYLCLAVDTHEEREEWLAAVQTTMRNCQGG